MRTSARITGAAVAMGAAALLVSGCGSGDDNKGGGKGGEGDGSSSSPSAPAKPSDGPTSGGHAGNASLPGVWNTTSGGKQYVLVIAGEKVTLFRDKKACTGSVADSGAEQSLSLKCPGGVGEERTNGTVGAIKGKAMKVSWNGGATDTYTKVGEAPKIVPKDPEKLRKLVPSTR